MTIEQDEIANFEWDVKTYQRVIAVKEREVADLKLENLKLELDLGFYKSAAMENGRQLLLLQIELERCRKEKQTEE